MVDMISSSFRPGEYGECEPESRNNSGLSGFPLEPVPAQAGAGMTTADKLSVTCLCKSL